MRRTRIKTFFTFLLALFFITAGALHFVRTKLYVSIMPPALPYPRELVWISGVCEILGGIGVLVPSARPLAGYGLIALLIAVFPANLHMAINNVGVEGVITSPVLLYLRLPLQFALIWWVWQCAKD